VVVVLIAAHLSIDEIRARMRNEWEVDVAELESRGDVIIRTTKEFYFPDDIPMCSEQSRYFSRSSRSSSSSRTV